MDSHSSARRAAEDLPDGSQWLVGGGEMGELIRSMDWSNTPLGPIEGWPHSLRTTVNLCLASNFPINIVWGPGYNQIYNDGYRVVVGEKHPKAMGMPYDECWASAWPAIGMPFERAWAGATSFIENQRMYLTRNGYLEETFFTFSLSPIRDEHGVIVGLFHPVTETTAKMLSERRMGHLRRFAIDTSEARSLQTAFTLCVRSLAAHELGLPFVLLYSLSEDGKQARLVEATGIVRGLNASPEVIDIADGESGWPLATILASGTTTEVEVNQLQQRFGEFACGSYPEGAHTALARALRIPGVEAPLGIFIAGISPRLPLNQTYRDHIGQLSAAISAALANALAYEQERKRAEMLADAAKLKTQFFGNVSHEFRTPLALMLGPIESVLATGENELSAPNRKQINIARRNSFRLLKLVNALLDFSRIEAGGVQASFEATNLSSWTVEIAGNFRSAIETAGLELVVDCPPLPEPVYVDRDMWEKIVLNLVSNAFKFTMRGRIEVDLKLVGDHVELAVSDTGCGIAPDQLTRVFERFHRVEGCEGRTHEGSGIGLALVDEFSRLHQGSVSVDSQLGVGSRFVVRLRRGMKHLPAERIKAEGQEASTATQPEAFTEEAARWTSLSPRIREDLNEPGSPSLKARPKSSKFPARILLVEDNPDMRDYILGVMGDDYDIDAVNNGEEAIKVVATSLPDLVLSDVMMPRMDGFALLRALRSDPRTQGLPIILLSARAGEEARVEGIEGGADDYLVKPFSARELKARVRTHLELQALRHEITVKRELLRTADALRQSEKLAVVGRLASSVAHEINNPLAAVTNLLFLAAGSLEGSEAGEYVKQAQAELRRVSNITTQTLRFHRQATKAQQTSLREVLDSVLTLFQGRPDSRGLGIERQYRSERLITAFEADLRQVFANLVSNALDASGRGGRIILRVHEATDWATGVQGMRVLVADSGHGMSEETRSRVYEPFFTTKGMTGTGLGLWVSRGILQNHKARVSIRSSHEPERHGTIFSIFFPLDGAVKGSPDAAAVTTKAEAIVSIAEG